MGAGQQDGALPADAHELPPIPGRRITSGGPIYPSYARAAYPILTSIAPHLSLISADQLELPPDHVITHKLSTFPAAFLSKAIWSLQQFSIRELNLLRPQQGPTAAVWDDTNLPLVTQCVQSYLECHQHFDATGEPLSDRLIVADLSTPALDLVRVNAVLPACQPFIPDACQPDAGKLLVFSYSPPFGDLCINARRYAHLPTAVIDAICTGPGGCSTIPAAVKQDGHLLTSDPAVLPTPNLQTLARMGKKYRFSPYPGEYTQQSRHEIMAELKGPILAYADAVERKAGMIGGMGPWKAEVMHMLRAEVAKVPMGTPLRPEGSTIMTGEDRRMLKAFLNDFAGQGVVHSHGQGQ